MKCLKTAAAIEWSKLHRIHVDEQGRQLHSVSGLKKRRFSVPSDASKHASFCNLVANSLQPWRRCLLWITQWGVWESSENWHLYYRLRQSYDDRLLIEEAPAHLFLDYEGHDLVSFIQIALSNGWDFSLLSDSGYPSVFASHDEWIEVVMQDEAELEKITAEWVECGIKLVSTS